MPTGNVRMESMIDAIRIAVVRSTGALLRVLFLSVLFIAVSLSAIAAPYQSETTPKLATVKGTVTDVSNGTPLRKAFVRLRSATMGAYPSVTDDMGNFAIQDVEPGVYTLDAQHQGFLEGHYGETNDLPVQLKLGPGESLTSINIKLTPQAVVSGLVVDGDGDPWTHGIVNVFRVTSEHGKKRLQGYTSGSVDDQGQFRIAQIPPGRYYLSADPGNMWEEGNGRMAKPPDLQFQPTWYPGTLDTDSATPLILGPGQQLSGLEIRLQRRSVHRIRGHISGVENIPAFPDRGPFAARSISAQTESRVAVNSYSGILRPDGSFDIQYVPSGSYDVRIHQGYPPIELGYAKVEVGERDVEDVNIDLVAPRPLSGRVQVEGGKLNLSGLRFALVPADGGLWDEAAISPADGTFRFALVGLRRYRVAVRGDPANAFYIKRIRYADSESTAHTVIISGADSELLVTISTNGATVMARVAEANGTQPGLDLGGSQPAASQVVLIPERPFDEPRVAISDQHGVSALGNLAPGSYKAYAFQDVPDRSWEDPDFMEEIRSRGVDLQLKEGDAASVEVPLLRKADLAPILERLGLE